MIRSTARHALRAGRHRVRRAAFIGSVLGLAAGTLAARAADLAPPPSGPAIAPFEEPDYGRLTLTEENDGLLPDKWDRHYTQGAMVTYLSPTVRPEDFAARLFDGVSAYTPLFQMGAGVRRKFDVVAGQSIFTPVRYHDVPPDPTDRPFAGWLFGGGSLLQDTNGTMLENLELLGGVVGPAALGKEAQTTVHRLLGFSNKNLDETWRYQLRNEPGFMLTYERKWRLWQTRFAGMEAEVIPEAGFTAGNVMTYAAAGATFRIGRNLNVDYGIQRIRPSLGGTAWFDASRLESDFGWYLFAGVQGRAVIHNIFLDGNSLATSRSVEKNVGVADLTAGASVFYRDWAKLDFTFTERTKEFKAQRQADHFGQASLAFRF